MRVGLGTGSTVAYLLARSPSARAAGTALRGDLAGDRARGAGAGIDACETSTSSASSTWRSTAPTRSIRDGWLVKGGGGAHTREKIVAAAARRFVVIVSAEKARAELRAAGAARGDALRRAADARELGPARAARRARASPDGSLIADYFGPVGDPRELAARLSATAGRGRARAVRAGSVSEILIAGEDGVTRRAGGKPAVSAHGRAASRLCELRMFVSFFSRYNNSVRYIRKISGPLCFCIFLVYTV